MESKEREIEEKHLKFERLLETERRKKRKRLAIVILLVLLILLLSYFIYFLRHKEAPLPTVEIGRRKVITPPNFLFYFNGAPRTKPMNRPQDVKVHPATGNVYVTDLGNHRVAVFDSRGNFLFDFSKAGKTSLKYPHYLAFDPQGRVWVSDKGPPEKLYIFEATGEFVREFLPEGKGWKWQPEGLFFDEKGLLYVTEIQLNHQLLVFNPETQKLLLRVGKVGQALQSRTFPGYFAFPNSVVAVNGKIFVTDSTNRRLQVFDQKTGKFLFLFPTGGIPRGIDVGYKGRLHIVDAMGHNVMVYTQNGRPLVTFGTLGADLGQMFHPNGIDCDGRYIYVADTWNHRVDVWAWPPEAPLPKPKKYIPCLPALLLPLLLLAWWFWRKKYVANEDFFARVIADGRLKSLHEKMKKVYVTPSLYEKVKDYYEKDFPAERVLKPGTYSESFAQKIKEVYEVDEETAIALAIARRGARKPLFLVEDERTRQIADKLNVYNMDYEEFLVSFGLEKAEKLKKEKEEE